MMRAVIFARMVSNHSRVLQHKQLRSPHRELALKPEVFDKSNCARRYWQLYFPAIGWSAR
jgi:hypothetical protein